MQEQKKAALEKKAQLAASPKGQEESAQRAQAGAPLRSEGPEARRKLALGAHVSSVRVGYEAFEVGTGQVSFHVGQGCLLCVGLVPPGLFGLALNSLDI